MDTDPVFLGYMAKRDRGPEEGLPPHLVAAANATACGNGDEPREGLLETGGHNDCDLARDIGSLRIAIQHEQAKRSGPADPRPYTTYAYWTYPFWFDIHGRRRDGLHPSLQPPLLAHPPSMESYTLLGHDAVNLSEGRAGCSPLFCNYLWQEIPVNRWCLMETLEDAIAGTERIAAAQPEPGDYLIYQVWRGTGL